MPARARYRCLGRGGHERGARLLGAVTVLRQRLGAPLSPAEQYEQQVLSTQILASVWQVAWAEGRVMTLEHVIAYALEVSNPESSA